MAFQPTHAVPSAGLRAWSTPDPALDPIANLSPGLDLRVVERRDRWAHIEASNGWRGWVDADLLVERPESVTHEAAATEPMRSPTPVTEPMRSPTPVTEPMRSPTPAPEPPAGEALRWGVGAALLLLFSTLVDWNRPFDVDFGGTNFSGWDFPIVFLFDFDIDSTKGVSIGLVLAIAAVAAVAFAHRREAVLVWRVAGGVTLGAVALFLVQAQRLVSDFDDGWFLDFLGPGFYLATLAGFGLLVAPTRPGKATADGGSTPAS